MNIPERYTLPSAVYTRLVELTEWYQKMPNQFNELVGDAFHTKINDEQNRMFMENVLEPLGEPDETGYYVSGYRVDMGGNFVVLLMDTENSLQYPEEVVALRELPRHEHGGSDSIFDGIDDEWGQQT